jgi:hypothetical protein
LPCEKNLLFEREGSFTRANIFAAGDLAFSFAAAFDALQLMCLSIKRSFFSAVDRLLVDCVNRTT